MLALLFFSLSAFSQVYETVVEDIVFSSSSRVIITEDMIKKSQARDLPSLLLTAANISITSNAFQPTSISLRGGNSGHVLIIVDGIPFYDPSTIQRTGNLSSFNIKAIKKVEVIKGSQSVLYGGQALGGVIKIETLGDANSGFIETGTQSTYAGGVEFSGENLIARGFYKEKRAESSAKSSSNHYPFNQQNLDLIYRWKKSTVGFVKASYLRDSSNTPSSDINYQIVDVSDFKLSSEQGSVSSQILFKELKWQPRLSVGLQNGLRFYDFPSSPMNEDYKSQTHFIRVDAKPIRTDTMMIDLGFSYSYEDFIFQEFNIESADAFLEQRGVFAKFTSFIDEDTTLSYGGRTENWSGKNPVNVFQLGLTHKKTKAEISSGLKTPTLYQLYSKYGNPHLKAEEGGQVSLSQEFEKLSVTIFYSRFKNLITTTGTFPAIRYVNVKETETRGAEAIYIKEFNSTQSATLNISYQEPKDLSNHNWISRRPLLTTSLRYLHNQVQLEVLNIGTRKDVGPNGNVRLPSYTVLNLGINYKNTYLRIDNLADSRNQETYGYYSEGLAAVLGLSFNW